MAQLGRAPSIVEFLEGQSIVPVVTVESLSSAAPLADALIAGGIGCVEVTLRSSVALDAIRVMSERAELRVGAGTVLTTAGVDRAIAAGARFLVSPGLDANVVNAAKSAGVAALPGAATATEIQTALRLGVNTVKLFPADQLGGLGVLPREVVCVA